MRGTLIVVGHVLLPSFPVAVAATDASGLRLVALLQATFQSRQSAVDRLRKLGGTSTLRARQDLVTPVT